MNKSYLDSGRKDQKLKTRNKILGGAQYFLNQGKTFSLDDVARQAGMSRATIYRYYSSAEVLSIEAGLDLNIDHPNTIFENYKNLPFEEMILGIQDYFNRFSVDNEPALRRFLSTVMSTESPENKRGARRVQTMQLALNHSGVNLEKSEMDKLICVATIFMGLEPLIVTKDVCKLNNQSSLEVLKWGLELILKGLNPKTQS
ncbi:MAG: TetR/AcrR family transcriptional regulator [Bacteroidota bacterium]